MIRRRHLPDPLETSARPRWLIVWDMQFHVLESTELAPHTDLRRAFADCLKRWADDGWTIESDGRFGSCFCNRAGMRRLIAISPADPSHSVAPGPSWHESCPTCGE